jgi:charged multivesicular body protein 1
MVMDKFESQFEDLDVQTEYMEGAMGGATTLTTAPSEVDALMQQVADEHGLELNHGLDVPTNALGATGEPAQANKDYDDLAERLAKFRS